MNDILCNARRCVYNEKLYCTLDRTEITKRGICKNYKEAED